MGARPATGPRTQEQRRARPVPSCSRRRPTCSPEGLPRHLGRGGRRRGRSHHRRALRPLRRQGGPARRACSSSGSSRRSSTSPPALEGETDLDGRLGELWRRARSAATARAATPGCCSSSSCGSTPPAIPRWASSAPSAFQRHARPGWPAASTTGPTSSASRCPARPPTVAAQVIALLLGAAFQHRLDPAAVPDDLVVAGLRRLLVLTDRIPPRSTTSRPPDPEEPRP